MKNILSDKEEFEALIEKFSFVIRTSVQSFNPQKMGIDPEDIVQEIRIKLWKLFKSDKKIQNYSSYIKRVINSIIIDQIRASRRYERIVGIEKQRILQHHGNSDLPKRIIKIVNVAFNSLIDSRRKVVRWHLFGLNIHEISKLLDIDEIKTKNLLYRGLNDLKNILKSKGINYED